MPYPSEDLYPSENLYPGGPTAPGVRPTLDELAALIRARTRRRSNGLRGKFEEDSNPTKEQASEAIDQAVNETAGRWPSLVASLYPLARQVTLYRAALLVERSYFPESAHSGDGTVQDELYADWDKFSRELTAMSRRLTSRGNVGTVTLESRSAAWRRERGEVLDAWHEDAV